MGRPDLASDPDFATLPARRRRAAEIDALISEWTSRYDKREVMGLLQAVGVPAGAVLNGRDLLEDPHLKARGFFTRVDHPVGGPQLQRTWPFNLSRTPGTVRSPAPCLGEHTRRVLTGLLGYSDAEVDELEAAGVVAYAPAKVQA
jgi:crotonobetainyl-CoA:carnitine CoA-transferase CaiB-like acyl-CoA transferase